MAQPGGLRLLSLDGGGTRGLSTLYILRGLMGRAVSGEGGHVRPCEYFDLIGGSGLSGLCALLFIRFCYTIDQAIEYLHEVSKKLDGVESFRIKVLQGSVDDAEEWLSRINKYKEPAEQREALRAWIIDISWEEIVKKNITDGLEQYLHMENGEFNFKSPSAVIEAGRPKAFVVSSESQGYGPNGGFDHSRQYNVPILHRTYNCRHGKTLYTFYAIGLATVAAPGIIKSGVIFPNFEATGRHTIHNPTRLILEESSKLWPGLRVSCLVSIGTGIFEIDNRGSDSFASRTSRACWEICNDNELLAEEMKRFVIPYDKQLAPVYFRFNLPTEHAYLENWEKETLQEDVVSWLKKARVATQCAYAADSLGAEGFPTTAEDFIALASLAALLQALLVAGYTHEAAIVNDAISNFILYEAASTEAGSFRKLAIATEAEQIRRTINGVHKMNDDGHPNETPMDLRSEAEILIGLMAFGDDLQGGPRPSGQLRTLFDYAAGAYYVLSVLRRGDQTHMEESRFRNISRQLSSAIGVPVQMEKQFSVKVEGFLEFAALAALCEAGNVQFLRGTKGLIYNGSLIRRVDHVLRSTSMKGFSPLLVESFANMLALSIYFTNWSPFRDDAIITLLDAASVESDKNWSLVNLALERYYQAQGKGADNFHNPHILPACKKLLEGHERVWATDASELFETSAKNGWFGLLSKWLRRERLTSSSEISLGNNFASKEEAAFNQAAHSGFPYILKAIVEGLGLERCKKLANRTNSQGQTPLHLACKHRAPKEVFRLLYILGAYVNSQCHLGRTPLHYCLPNPKAVPPVFDELLKMLSEQSLPTIALLDIPQIYDRHCNAKSVDPRAYDFRVLIHQLLARNADMSIPDQEGMTPVHRAAKEGWIENLDVFFMREHGDAEQLQRTCLKLRDYAGYTAVDYARMNGNLAGEDILVSEMKKRAMEIPPRPPQHLLPLDAAPIMKFTIGKSRSPVRRAPSSHDVSRPPNFSPLTPSPQIPPGPKYPPPTPTEQALSGPPYSTTASNNQGIPRPPNHPSPPTAPSPKTIPKPPNYPPPATSPAQYPPRSPQPLVYVYEDPEFPSTPSQTQLSSQTHEKFNPPSTTHFRTSTFSQNPTLSPTSTLTPSMNYDSKDVDKQSMKSSSTFSSKPVEPKPKSKLFEKWGKKK